MKRLMAWLAPFLILAALAAGDGISFFTYWVNPWSTVAWGFAWVVVAASTAYCGWQYEELRLAFIGVGLALLGFILNLVPHDGSAPLAVVWLTGLDIVVGLSALLIWYRVLYGTWLLQRIRR
jgi:hypothetical protein